MAADWENAKKLYPSVHMGEREWLAFFDTPAGFHAMGRIFGDIYAEVKAQEEKEMGVRRMGRRPRPEAVSLDEVYRTVYPEPYSTLCFAEAVAAMMKHRGLSQRNLAQRLPFTQSRLSRLLSGELSPDLYTMECIAEALKVRPGYFTEWRAHYMGQLVTRVLLDAPHVGIKAFKGLTTERRAFDEAVSA